MRFAPNITIAAAFRVALAVTSAVALPGLAALASADPAAAQGSSQSAKKRTRIEITRRSYLDPGNVVKPGSRPYLDYALPPGWFYPGYGEGGAAGPGPITGLRWPLPGQFDLPGF